MTIRLRMRLFLAALAVIVAGCIWLTLLIDRAHVSAKQATQHGIAKQLGVSILNYQFHHGNFPPAYVADENGNRMHSWRVLIAQMDSIDLIKEDQKILAQYNFQQAWNSSQNLPLLQHIGLWRFYDRNRAQDSTTMFLAVVGEDTAFPGTDVRRLGEEVPYSAGIIVEVENSGVPWTEPRDISVDEFVEIFRHWKKQKTSFWSMFSSLGEGPAILFADGQVRRLTEDMTEDEVRAIFQITRDPDTPPPRIWVPPEPRF